MIATEKLKNRVIFALLVVIMVMVVAIVVLAQNNLTKLSGENTGNNSDWKVTFTNITTKSITGNARDEFQPYFTETHAFFHVDFVAPGDAVTYELEIANLGKLDAKLNKISRGEEGKYDFIKYDIQGIKEGDVLLKNEKRIVTVTVKYDLTATEAHEIEEDLSVIFDFVQNY